MSLGLQVFAQLRPQDSRTISKRSCGTLNATDPDWQVPTASAITQARQRLDAEPVMMLFGRACVPLAGLGTKGVWLAWRRLMAIDATSLRRGRHPGQRGTLRPDGVEAEGVGVPETARRSPRRVRQPRDRRGGARARAVPGNAHASWSVTSSRAGSVSWLNRMVSGPVGEMLPGAFPVHSAGGSLLDWPPALREASACAIRLRRSCRSCLVGASSAARSSSAAASAWRPSRVRMSPRTAPSRW